MVVLTAMVSCLGANAIDKVVRQTGMTGEITSVTDLASSMFMLQNGEGDEAVVLYTPSGWDIKVAPLATAIASEDNGGFFKLEALDNHYLIPVYNIDMKTHRETPNWGDTNAYVNTQPDGDVIFGLAGRNSQHGQDGPNLAVWDITYEEGQGFVFHNVGRNVYIGHDGKAARPSTTPVYWRAYQRYGAYVKSEVEATYDVALAAAKATDAKIALEAAATAYATDNDVEKYGDAINAAIDIINECEAINAKYSNYNFDETAAPLAAEVLQKYNAGEYKNAAELRIDYISAVKAQSTAGANMTGAIVNAEINGAEGWTIERPKGGNGPLLNNASFEYWAGSADPRDKASFDYYQVITGLPNGIYTVGADMYNSLNGEGGDYTVFSPTCGVYAKVGETEVSKLVDVEGTELSLYTTDQIKVTDGTLRIGVKNFTTPMAARWFVADNFKLTLVDVLPTYTITIADDIENGTVEATPAEAVEGATVSLTITPAEGYELEAVTVKDAEENDVEVSEEYTFIMPATAVTVAATFAKVAEPEPDYADVKLTYVDGNDDTADTAYGEVTEAVIGFNKIANGTVALGNAGWGVNKIGYVKVDASKFNGTITSAKMTAEVSGSTDSKRQTGWGVGYNSSEWSADLTYNTADKSITPVGTEYWTTTKAANVFEPVEFDITEAFAEGNVANILVYELAAAGGTIKNIKVAVEYIPGAPKLANRTFDENPDDVIKVTTQGYERNVKGDQVSGMQPVTGWTPNNIQTEKDPGYTGAIFAYGSENKLNDKVAAPAEAPEGSESTSALGLAAVWEGIAQYTQAVTLPSGDYKMTYTAYNGANTGNITKNLFGFIAEDGTEYLSETKSFTVEEWKTYEIAFTIEEETKGNISVGFIGSGGSSNAPHLFVDNVTLEKVLGVELALVDLKKAIEEAEATVSTYPVGDALFQYAEAEITPLTEAIATAQAAYEAAESKEAVETATETLNAFVADFAPKATTPDAEKQYTLKNKQADLYMTLSEEGISIAEEPCALTFEATDGGKYYLTDGEYYVGLGTDNWSMSSAADKKEALAISCTVVAGVAYYTLGESKGMVGVDYPKKENMGCWANKGTGDGDAVLWTIEEYVAPPVPAIVLNAPTFSAEEGTQAEPTMLAADETLKITYTADNLEENGLTADDVKVKVTVMVTGDLPENMMVMGSTTAHRVMSETFYIPLGETDFPVALKEGYVYQNIVVMAAELVKPETEEAAEETLAAYVGAPVQFHWVGIAEEYVEPAYKPEIAKTIEIEGIDCAGVAYAQNPLDETGKNRPAITFDVNEICTALDIDNIADAQPYIVNVTTGNFVENTTDGWRNIEGDATIWNDATNGYCLKMNEPASGMFDYASAHDKNFQVNDTYVAQWGLVKDDKAVVLKVTIRFVSEEDWAAAVEDATGISGIDAAKAKANGKYLQNGKIVIVKNGKTYSVSGVEIK